MPGLHPLLMDGLVGWGEGGVALVGRKYGPRMGRGGSGAPGNGPLLPGLGWARLG